MIQSLAKLGSEVSRSANRIPLDAGVEPTLIPSALFQAESGRELKGEKHGTLRLLRVNSVGS